MAKSRIEIKEDQKMENNTTYSCMEAWKNNETYLITCCFEDESCKDGVIGLTD